jgi:hypothetical protein
MFVNGRQLFIGFAGLILAASLSLFGQDTASTASTTQVQSKAPAPPPQRWHDQNGDGICDVCGQAVGSGRRISPGSNARQGRRYGPGDGSGNQGNGPKDGTGYGRKSGRGDPSTCPGNRGSGRGHRGGRGRG